MRTFANTVNWHRYVIALLGAILLLGTLMVNHGIPIPAELRPAMPWIVLGVAFLGFLLPRVQTATGPGAPPLLSPPADPTPPTPSAGPVDRDLTRAPPGPPG